MNTASGPNPTMIEVFPSGRYVDTLDPRASSIQLEDVARGLAFNCRYGGHVSKFYSVAEHSVLVHDLMEFSGFPVPDLLAALFHDAAEAYLGDVVSPLKRAMEALTEWSTLPSTSPYKILSARMDRAVALQFQLDEKLFKTHSLHVHDMWARRIEAQRLTRSGGKDWAWENLPRGGVLPLSVGWAGGLSPETAEHLWLNRVRKAQADADWISNG